MAKEFICATCGEPITSGEKYASIGGNIDPYMPAKLYHIRHIPSIKSVDTYDFLLCEVCMPADPKPATFVVHVGGVNHYYCDEHGAERKLTRGIPVNYAEPESRCKDCQAPIEHGIQCADCLVRTNVGLIKRFVEGPDIVEMLAKQSMKLDIGAMVTDLFDSFEVSQPTPQASTPKRFSVDWFRAHVDHFIISFMVGVPLLVVNAIASNVFTHHAAQILRAFHIPATIMHGLGY